MSKLCLRKGAWVLCNRLFWVSYETSILFIGKIITNNFCSQNSENILVTRIITKYYKDKNHTIDLPFLIIKFNLNIGYI